MFDAIEFPADDELRKPVTEDTVVKARARKGDDGEVEIRQGQSDFGPWISIPMIVTGGDYDGRYASHIVTVNPTSPKFREVVEVITGIDLSQGFKMDKEAFKSALSSHMFEVEISPGKKNPSYTEVKRFIKRLDEAPPAEAAAPLIQSGGDTSAPAAADTAPAVTADAVDDGDDIPF